MNQEITRDSMVFYSSFFEAIRDLPAEDFKKCACSIIGYGLYGTEPETNGIEKTIHILIKPQIDKNNQRWVNSKRRHNTKEDADGREEADIGSEAEVFRNQDKDTCTGGEFPKVNTELPGDVDVTAEEMADKEIVGRSVSERAETANENDVSAAPAVPAGASSYDKDSHGKYENVYLSRSDRIKIIGQMGYYGLKNSIEYLSEYLYRNPGFKSGDHCREILTWVKDEPGVMNDCPDTPRHAP